VIVDASRTRFVSGRVIDCSLNNVRRDAKFVQACAQRSSQVMQRPTRKHLASRGQALVEDFLASGPSLETVCTSAKYGVGAGACFVLLKNRKGDGTQRQLVLFSVFFPL